ncbi:MAG: MFS transporter, partial [Mycobacterium sp.]|nr:MFS transporter [Mycobacterium sp.]
MTILTRDRTIEHWDAEDVGAWEGTGGATPGKKIAKRNLIWSIFALVAVPTLVGAMIRIPYTIAPARFGGRNWTIASVLLLLIPTVLTWYVMKQPGTSYITFMIVAAFAGFGGGNFASSMTNINAFYPERLKGRALGLNAGGGNV